MEQRLPELSWLENPQVYEVNRVEAHSDHCFYASREELEQGVSRLRQGLNGMWKFAYAEKPSLRQADFYREGYDDSGFGGIRVPGHIQLQGYDKCQYVNTMYPWDGHSELRPPHIDWEYNPVGCYVREFDLEEALEDRRVFLSFQGVETAFYVWLNGEFIGYGEDSFTPSEFEVTEQLRKKGNRLAVEVYKRSSASWLEDQDFFRFSGIFREVYLYGIPDRHVRDLFVKADTDDDYRDGVFSAEIELEGEAEAVLSAVLKDGENSVAYRWDGVPCAGKVTLAGRVERARLWSGEDPYLYTLYIELCAPSGELIEIVPQKVGFRRFEKKDGLMCLNGKRLVFRGINRHEFGFKTGRAITEKEMLWDIAFMKRHNINAVRTCHYPNQTLWYHLCDQYGIYLMDETNLESHGSWQKMSVVEPSWNVPGSLPEWEAAVVDRARSMLERDKNHPSVLIWSCGNESYAGTCLAAVSSFFRKRDKTRLVHYEGVFHNREFDDISDMESRMYAKPAEVEEYLTHSPQKPFVLCEYMHAMGNSLGGMKKYTDLEDRYPLYQGGFIWDYIDQALPKRDGRGGETPGYGGDFGDRPTDYNFCGNGIVYADRAISPKAQEVKYLYQDIRLRPDAGGVEIENRRLFTDTSGLEFIYTVLRDGEAVYSCRFDAQVRPQTKQYVEAVCPTFQEPGEYVRQVSAALKRPETWAEAGYEIAFGQSGAVRIEAAEGFRAGNPGPAAASCKAGEALSAVAAKRRGEGEEQSAVAAKRRGEGEEQSAAAGERECADESAESPENRKRDAIQVIHGDVNIGVRGEGFHVIFSRQEGGIVSLVYGGREWIARPPMPVYWRASTDNDKANGFARESAVWLGAGAFQLYRKDCAVEEEQGIARVTYRYHLPTEPKTQAEVRYEVNEEGRVRVRALFHGQKGLPQLPLFGMRLRLPGVAESFRWYGKGPEENYCDRCQGARLGIFEDTPQRSVSRYLVPQECGNRTGVRWLKVFGGEGEALSFTALKQPFDMSVLPYTAEELENALHLAELPDPAYTVVAILAKQRGVGGDDTWGAPVYPEFCVGAEEDIELEFEIGRGIAK